MMVTILVIVGVIAVIAIVGILFEKHQARCKRKRLSTLFAGRTPLTGEQLYAQYFESLGVRSDIPQKVRSILEGNVDADLSKLKDTDDLSKDLSFFWAMDSMADVETIVAFEKEFGMKISDGEAEKMKTLRDMVMTIDRKIKGVQPAGGAYVAPAAGAPSAHP